LERATAIGALAVERFPFRGSSTALPLVVDLFFLLARLAAETSGKEQRHLAAFGAKSRSRAIPSWFSPVGLVDFGSQSLDFRLLLAGKLRHVSISAVTLMVKCQAHALVNPSAVLSDSWNASA
jgi:hypothetical protein